VERERLHAAAAQMRSRDEAKRAAAGESWREILLAPPIMTIRFLHIGVAFRRKSDIWQVIQSKKCKKKSIPREKYKKASFFERVALQRVSFLECRNFA
jgi:hypothetical protein